MKLDALAGGLAACLRPQQPVAADRDKPWLYGGLTEPFSDPGRYVVF